MKRIRRCFPLLLALLMSMSIAAQAAGGPAEASPTPNTDQWIGSGVKDGVDSAQGDVAWKGVVTIKVDLTILVTVSPDDSAGQPVADAGDPLPGVSVISDCLPPGGGQTGADGKLTITGLAVGVPRDFTATAQGYVTRIVTGVIPDKCANGLLVISLVRVSEKPAPPIPPGPDDPGGGDGPDVPVPSKPPGPDVSATPEPPGPEETEPPKPSASPAPSPSETTEEPSGTDRPEVSVMPDPPEDPGSPDPAETQDPGPAVPVGPGGMTRPPDDGGDGPPGGDGKPQRPSGDGGKDALSPDKALEPGSTRAADFPWWLLAVILAGLMLLWWLLGGHWLELVGIDGKHLDDAVVTGAGLRKCQGKGYRRRLYFGKSERAEGGFLIEISCPGYEPQTVEIAPKKRGRRHKVTLFPVRAVSGKKKKTKVKK